MNKDTEIKTINQDARIFLARANNEEKYDLIFGDAFNDFAIPYHLTTLEFGKLIKDHLSSEGYYAVNVIDDYRYGRFVSSFIATLKEIFPYVYLAPLTSDWEEDRRNTFVVLAGEKELDIKKWQDILWTTSFKEDSNFSPEEVGFFIDEKRVEELIEEKRGIVLTDDFVPVDNFLAPVFNSK